ncbi:MAG: hypothetical protein AB1631_19805 [Acidobacteriota bacterium]
MKIYVASSWRNEMQPVVVQALRDAGHEVYDFRNPAPDNHGFRWLEIDPDWKQWTPEQFRQALGHPVAVAGFKTDFEALATADKCVLVMPCGRSAHLEAGFAIGAGKPTAILLADGEPELMYKMAHLCLTLDEIVQWADEPTCHYVCAAGRNVALTNDCAHTAINND